MRTVVDASQDVGRSAQTTTAHAYEMPQAAAIAESSSTRRLSQISDILYASPRMVALRALSDSMIPAKNHGPIVLQRRPVTLQEAEEIVQLGNKFKSLQHDYRRDMDAIDAIIGLVHPLPVNIQYLANRMDSTLRPLENFFTAFIDMATGDRAQTVRLLQRLRSRHKWYTEDQSGQALLTRTLEDAKTQADSLKHVSVMEKRRSVFQEDRIAGLSKRELRENPGSVFEVANARTDAIRDDPEHSASEYGWHQVDDYPPKERNSPSGTSNKFINMYHPSAMIMLENYREKGKGYYASDALFDQWMRVTSSATLFDLPESFPKYFYRNHIDNKAARARAEELLGEQQSVWIAVNSVDWNSLVATDNVKSTMNILGEYNQINRARRLPTFKCLGVLIYKGPSMKFTMGRE